MRLVLAFIAAIVLASPIAAQEAQSPAQRPAQTEARERRPVVPPERVTEHTLELPGRTLRFRAAAGVLPMPDEEGRVRADIGYVAYTLDAPGGGRRPITFAINGGPGASSAWLHLGMMGPWRLDFVRAQVGPSAVAEVEGNAETWLDFTDLVFIDPPGTGFARVLDGDEARRQIWSADGDTEYVAAFIRRWLIRSNRLASPKIFVGESYGGFRGPRVARALQQSHGVGLSALILVAPVLDFSWRIADRTSPLPWISTLPAMAATARAAAGTVRRADLAEAEAYARGPMAVDLLAGRADEAAVARLVANVARFTGLDAALVRRVGGRVENWVFQRERERASARVASGYDATVTGLDPQPDSFAGRFHDPILDGMRAPLTTATLDLYARRLDWLPTERRYSVLNGEVGGAWQWGRGLSPPSAMPDLASALAVDPGLEVVVAHGLFDLVTSYFQSALLLDQLPPTVARDRVRLVTFEGGHMFYDRDESRRAMRVEAEAVVRRAVERAR